MKPVPACTIATSSHLSLARVMIDSYVRHHPGAAAFVCLVDAEPEGLPGGEAAITLVRAADLAVPAFRNMAFRYEPVELCTAVKPFLLTHLRERFGLDRVFYLDPDVLVLDRLAALESALDAHPVVLTPHLTAPVVNGAQSGERQHLRRGVFNLGFLGLRLDDRTAPLLEWWQERLRRLCIEEPGEGLFVDQVWMQFAPCFLDDVAVIRDPTCNVAWWNLSERPVGFSDGRWQVAGRPVAFYHFSGFAWEAHDIVTRHRRDLALAERPALRALFAHYRDLLVAAGHESQRRRPYGYARFEGGDDAIPKAVRRLLQRVDPEGQRWPDPFETGGADSFLRWLVAPLRMERGTLNRAALALWESRSDLPHAFPRVCDEDLPGFVTWLLTPGMVAASGFPESLLAGVSVAPRVGSRPPSAYVRTVVPHDAHDHRAPRALLTSVDLSRPGRLADWLNEPAAPGGAGPTITTLALLLHESRADLQEAFPDPLGRDRLAYAHWFARHAARDHGLHGRLVAPVRRSLPLRYRVRDAWAGLRARRRPAPPATARARAPAMASPPRGNGGDRGVNLAGYFDDGSGVAQMARGTAEALEALAVPFCKLPLDQDHSATLVDARVHLPQGLPFRLTLVHANAREAEAALSVLPLAATAGGLKVGYWFWELAHFPLEDAPRFHLFDEIWAPSRFCSRAFEALSTIPVRHVPPHVPLPRPLARTRGQLGLEERRFYFLCAIDAGSVPERKNPFGAVEAFRRLRQRTAADVGLVLKVRQAHAAPGLMEALRRSADGLPVAFIDGGTSREEFDTLLQGCDAVLSLHRSEGLGLVVAEGMLLNKPVVATAYGGVVDFLDEETGFPVSFGLQRLERAHPPYPRGAVWADPDLDHAAELMRTVVEQPGTATLRAAAGAQRAHALFGRDAAARRFRGEIERLLGA